MNFTWTISWQGGNHTAIHRLCVHDALRKDRRIPMPPGWEVAVTALKIAGDARDISQRSLPPDVRKLNCKLLGVPRRFELPQNDLSPGACVALVVNGRRVNYVLLSQAPLRYRGVGLTFRLCPFNLPIFHRNTTQRGWINFSTLPI